MIPNSFWEEAVEVEMQKNREESWEGSAAPPLLNSQRRIQCVPDALVLKKGFCESRR